MPPLNAPSGQPTATTDSSNDLTLIQQAQQAFQEAPLLSLGSKSPSEMTDEELSQWDARLRQHQASFPTLASHLRGKKEKESASSVPAGPAATTLELDDL